MFWLLVAWNRETDEYKYFFSNAPADTPLQTLVAVAFKRAHVEHLFRVLKSEVGFGHYEGRSYKGMMRHLTLCQVLLLFLSLWAAGLRGKSRTTGTSTGSTGGARAPHVTVEQLATAFNGLCRRWLEQRHGRGLHEQISFILMLPAAA